MPKLSAKEQLAEKNLHSAWWFALSPPDDYTRTLRISQPFLIFEIFIEPLGAGNRLELQNPILSATLNELREEKDKDIKSDYSLEDFEEEVFTKLNPQEIGEIIQCYLGSTPDKKSADYHYQKITDRKGAPEGGRIIKL